MTSDVEYSVHKVQNSQDDTLCKSDVQVGIHLKLLLIKLNPVVFLLIAKGQLVRNFKSSVEELLVSYYLLIIFYPLKEHSCLKYIRCLARLGNICTIKKHEKHLWRNVTLLKVILLPGCFTRFLNCTNGIKSWNASYKN